MHFIGFMSASNTGTLLIKCKNNVGDHTPRPLQTPSSAALVKHLLRQRDSVLIMSTKIVGLEQSRNVQCPVSCCKVRCLFDPSTTPTCVLVQSFLRYIEVKSRVHCMSTKSYLKAEGCVVHGRNAHGEGKLNCTMLFQQLTSSQISATIGAKYYQNLLNSGQSYEMKTSGFNKPTLWF